MRHFAETIVSDTESPIAGVRRAYEIMRIVDAAYRSAQSRIIIELT
ncbi:MAG: hypothetical protein ACE5PV_02310 [Candidatus Poribacteria bacterium]